MADLNSQNITAQLMAKRFDRSGPVAEVLSDPIADTPIVVTLDQLQPYDLNPRVTRNPRYDDIKASIRERGLDAPPVITRRQGETHYIIRNGGNTRLSILNELWAETKDERFFRISCLFKPWSERGEIIALTGHLAENELHGSLSFIEKALGIEKARELYEQECGLSLTQTELARRLSADGYPITQPHISRMQDAIRFLLPAIPAVLYSGLGKPQVERLTALRKAGARIWEAHAAHKTLAVDFPSLFQDVLATFDGAVDSFAIKRVQDELIGQMADLLNADYDSLALELDETESRQHVLGSEPAQHSAQTDHTSHSTPNAADLLSSRNSGDDAKSERTLSKPATPSESLGSPLPAQQPGNIEQPSNNRFDQHSKNRVNLPTKADDGLISGRIDDTWPDSGADVLQAAPTQVSGLQSITDVWHIDSNLDVPNRLRTQILQCASEIAEEVGHGLRVTPIDEGTGFSCESGRPSESDSVSPTGRAVLILLHCLSARYPSTQPADTAPDGAFLIDALGPLLQGQKSDESPHPITRLSDNALIKFFRLIRLARRLQELENNMESDNGISTDS